MAKTPTRSYLTVLHDEDPEKLRAYLRRMLEARGGNVTATARHLEVSRTFLWWWLARLKMNDEPVAIRREIRARFWVPLSRDLDRWLHGIPPERHKAEAKMR